MCSWKLSILCENNVLPNLLDNSCTLDLPLLQNHQQHWLNLHTCSNHGLRHYFPSLRSLLHLYRRPSSHYHAFCSFHKPGNCLSLPPLLQFFLWILSVHLHISFRPFHRHFLEHRQKYLSEDSHIPNKCDSSPLHYNFSSCYGSNDQHSQVFYSRYSNYFCC